jgi:two-component system CheB/CheR fusion protein
MSAIVKDGHCAGVRWLIRDVTERKRAQEELRLLNEQLEQRVQDRTAQLTAAKEAAEAASIARSRFIANMSHDLRTPLNAIIGMAQVLNMQTIGPLNERQKACVVDIFDSSTYLLNLLNNLLELSLSDSGQLQLHLTDLDISLLITKSVALLRKEAEERHINWAFEVADDLPPIDADGPRIMEVLCNLLSNAVKATPQGGTVGVRASHQDRQVRVEVWDTGLGIAPENLTRLFRPFERLEPAASTYPGVGLGLVMSKQLIELHGGSIEATSDGEGQGATFRFTLPVKTAQ